MKQGEKGRKAGKGVCKKNVRDLEMPVEITGFVLQSHFIIVMVL